MPHILAVFMMDLLRLCVWLGLLAGIFAVVERRWSLRPQKFFRNSFWTDLGYYFLSGFAPKFLLMLPVSVLALSVHRWGSGDYYAWVSELPLVVRMPAALVVAEIGAYWGHRWSHENALLWRFHSIHHSPAEMDWLVNTRAHPVDMFFSRFCGLAPMYLLGLAQPLGDRLDMVPLLITVIGTAWGFFIHANVRWRLGGLERLVSSPAFHHWHHTNDGPASLDRNYAAMLPWIDQWFGTFYLPDRWPVRYGVDEPIPEGMTRQLVRPFVPLLAVRRDESDAVPGVPER